MASKADQIETHLLLANAVEVISETVKALAGEETSNRLNGELLEGEFLAEQAGIALQTEFASVLAL